MRHLATTLAAALALAGSGRLSAQRALACTPHTALAISGIGAPPRTPLLLTFGGRTVGGGVSDASGAYQLALTVGAERPGTYPITVDLRASRVIVHRTSCTVPGGTPVPTPGAATPTAAATPGATATPAATATVQPVTRPVADFDGNGDGRVTCADFASQAEAQEALAAGYVNLDEDRDGIPCEALPRQ